MFWFDCDGRDGRDGDYLQSGRQKPVGGGDISVTSRTRCVRHREFLRVQNGELFF